MVRKTKREVIEMITVWAAIESLAARFAAERRAKRSCGELRELFAKFREDPADQLGEYSQANMAFHKAIIRMGGCGLMSELTDTLFIHMRAVRAVTMRQDNRARRSIVDHMNIIAALESRDPDLANAWCANIRSALPACGEHGEFLDGLQQRRRGKRRKFG